ncbi:MAG: hypothetical protein Q9204_002434 [Flavoplaca sp. TL-2023a]
MSTPSRKVVITALGDVSNLSIVKTTIPDPPRDHVQIRIFYSGFSGTDINMRLVDIRFVKNGPSCSKHQIGDIVACLTVYDAQSEYANQPQRYLVPIPEGTDLQQATALVDWSTAYSLAINTGKVSSGQKVFVHGISGAVGYACIILYQLQGAQVYGTYSEKNFARIEKLGAIPFIYTDKDWIESIKAFSGADLVFDPLGFESWDESYSILSPTGHLLGYGGNLATLNGQAERSVLWPTIKLLGKNLYWSGKKTTFFYITRDSKSFSSNLAKIFKIQRTGEIKVPIKAVFNMEDIKTAHESWSKSSGLGSFLVKVSDP